MIPPAMSWPSWTPATVSTGIMALRSVWRKSTARSATPLARAGFTYSSRGASRLAQRRRGAGPPPRPPPRDPAGRNPAEPHREEEDQQQARPETRHGHAHLGE